MPPARRPIRLSVQTKVLIVILAVLVLLPAATVWIVNRHIEKQMLDEAGQTLATAEAVFLASLQMRSRTLVSRFRSLVREPRFKANSAVNDSRTMTNYLSKDLIKELDEDIEVILFTPVSASTQEAWTAGARREESLSLETFDHAVDEITSEALAGEPGTGSVSLDGKAFNIVAVPVTNADDGPVMGSLTLGIRIGESALRDLKSLTRAEIVIVANGKPAASTLASAGLTETLLRQMGDSASSPNAKKETTNLPIELVGEHFLARSGSYDAKGPQRGFHYLLLSSYERQVQDLEATRRTLVELSVVGILLSAMAVGVMVRRIIRPLRDLRDSAEAVGRGDFSQRIERFSNDECGDLAVAFNGMTSNLQSSRAELEKTVETLKTTQAQLVQSEKLSAVGQFVAGVAHELNNPLTAVIGFSEILVQDEQDEKVRRNLDLIAKSAHRCHKIVQSLLAFSRQHTPERKLVDMNQLIEDVLEIMAYDLRTSNIKVVKEFALNLPVIMADAHQLQQVFVNILSNARQAIQPVKNEGQIILRTRATDEWIYIEIQDNGPGIDPANVAKIFDPFFTTKPVGQGTGLGLSLTYGIVQEHGGKISVRSKLGQGATFLIDLPVGADTPASTSKQSGKNQRSTSSTVKLTGKIVLVVDDEPWIVELVRELVQREGCVVETTTSGERAVEMIFRRRFDVIISDWKMPGLNGMRVHEQVSVRDPAAASRMLFMTGDVVSDTFQEFLRKNERPCLSKPFSIEDFRKAVAAILGKG